MGKKKKETAAGGEKRLLVLLIRCIETGEGYTCGGASNHRNLGRRDKEEESGGEKEKDGEKRGRVGM